MIVVVEDLHKQYRLGNEVIPAVRGVSLEIQQGRFIAIMGASGSGKTTLLHLIAGLDQADWGSVLIDGQSITNMSDQQRTLFRRRRLGIVFQSFNLLPTLTAIENVALPLLVDGQPARKARKKADELIHAVHLEQRMNHRPATLSGGEQQRVAVARALMNEPAVVLADEPTGNLDPTASLEIWNLLRDLSHETGTTIAMVTHEPAAAAHADATHVLKEGRFVGTIESEGQVDAALVAARYAKLAD